LNYFSVNIKSYHFRSIYTDFDMISQTAHTYLRQTGVCEPFDIDKNS